MTRERIITRGFNLNPKNEYWFSGPEIEHEGYGYVKILGNNDWTYSQSERGIAVVQGKIIRAQAQHLADQGLFSMGVYFRGPRRKDLLAVVSHPSGLLIAADIKNLDTDLKAPRSRRHATVNEKWKEGESNQELFWFEEADTKKWEEYVLQITG